MAKSDISKMCHCVWSLGAPLLICQNCSVLGLVPQGQNPLYSKFTTVPDLRKPYCSFNKFAVLVRHVNNPTFLYMHTWRYDPLCRPTSSSCGGLLPLAEVYWPFGQEKRLVTTFSVFKCNFNNQKDQNDVPKILSNLIWNPGEGVWGDGGAPKKLYSLFLLIEEISFWPELSSPPCFRFQGGWSERDGEGQSLDRRKSLCLI